jgi:hypothetical protein
MSVRQVEAVGNRRGEECGAWDIELFCGASNPGESCILDLRSPFSGREYYCGIENLLEIPGRVLDRQWRRVAGTRIFLCGLYYIYALSIQCCRLQTFRLPGWAAYSAGVYFMPLFTGAFADKMGFRRAMLLAFFSTAVGFCWAHPHNRLVPAIVLLIIEVRSSRAYHGTVAKLLHPITCPDNSIFMAWST